MFRGINTVSLDDKGRIAIPSRCREVLDICDSHGHGQLVVTIDPEERCLLMYPLIYWEEIEKKIEKLPSFNNAARRIQRLIIGHAADILLDNQGRILLPQELREYAGLKKRAVLIGQGKKIEIWDAHNWAEKRNDWLETNVTKENDLPAELQILSL